MWYGWLRDGEPADIMAEGDHGRFIYVSPANNVIIVRHGTEFGLSSQEWVDAFYRVAGEV